MHLATCPVCGVRFDLHASSAPPFLQPPLPARDLGRWFNEDYAMPVPRDEDELEDVEPDTGEQESSDSPDADE